MKREVRLLREKAVSSLLLCIEHFNRPIDIGRAQAVLIFLDHSFEMLLKASILHRGGKIRDRGAKQTIGFDTCVRRALDDGAIKFLIAEQALTLQAINGLRDAAHHHLLDIPEQQLYLHTQSGITLFSDILSKVFGEKLVNHLPERVLPVSTNPPKDMGVLLQDELTAVKDLLKPNVRRRIEARTRIRALAIVEGTTRGERVQPSDTDLDNLLDKINADETPKEIFPGVASLALSTEGEGIPFHIRITKKEGVPVQLVPEGTPGATVVAIHKADATAYYSLGRDEVAKRVKLSPPMTTAVIRYMRLRDDPDCFRVFPMGKTKFERYSPRAVERIQQALPGLDRAAIWKNHGPKRNKQ
jgi:hypothetical protein